MIEILELSQKSKYLCAPARLRNVCEEYSEIFQFYVQMPWYGLLCEELDGRALALANVRSDTRGRLENMPISTRFHLRNLQPVSALRK